MLTSGSKMCTLETPVSHVCSSECAQGVVEGITQSLGSRYIGGCLREAGVRRRSLVREAYLKITHLLIVNTALLASGPRDRSPHLSLLVTPAQPCQPRERLP